MSFRKYSTVLVIVIAWLAVVVVGVSTHEPMIGDEVTHYYMLVTQAGRLPAPSVTVQIPVAYSDAPVEQRFYPHVFLWHYVGALVWTALGKTVTVVQLYHSLFLLQLLVFAWLLIRHETAGQQPAAESLYLVLIASLPMTLMFSVAFYQDVPATAQLLAALYFLRRRRLLASLVFLLIGLCIKETVLAIAPAYLLCVWFFYRSVESRGRAALRVLIVVAALVAHTWVSVQIFDRLGFQYYPYHTFRNQVIALNREIRNRLVSAAPTAPSVAPPVANAASTAPKAVEKSAAQTMEEKHYTEISVSPGDLRRPLNWLMYGGGLMWALVAAGVLGLCWPLANGRVDTGSSSVWLLLSGVWYLAFVGFQMRTAPDARFFLPGVILLLLPVACWASRLPGIRLWLPIVYVLGLVQGGLVLSKVYELRAVKPGVRAAIEYLTAHPPTPNAVFMYPEGNYRLFPCRHDWYLNFALRDFWRADNDSRIPLLQHLHLGDIVIKKYLVGAIDPDMNNLGIYPDFFVEQIERDKRFKKVLDNADVSIYEVPAPDRSEKEASAVVP